jgi:hypothetical protein
MSSLAMPEYVWEENWGANHAVASPKGLMPTAD